MSYQIDSVPVNNRIDWRHARRAAAPQARREEQFPGINERFSVTALAMPPDLIIVGFLEATAADRDSAMTDLHALLSTYEFMQGDATTHTVTIHGVEFTDCQLLAIQPGRISYANDGAVPADNTRIRIPTTFLWRQMRHNT